MARVANHEATSPVTRPSASRSAAFLSTSSITSASLRTKRHADADFACAAANGICHEPVETDQRQGQRDGCEDGEQRGLKAAARAGCGLQLAHGLNIGSGEVGINGVQSGTDFGGSGFGRMRRANNNISVIRPRRQVDRFAGRRFFQAGMAHITDDSDDGAPLHMVIVNVDAAADRVAIGEVFIREALIDNGESGPYGPYRRC